MNLATNEMCNQLQNKFNILSIFSSKLKHLQFSYNQLKNILIEIKHIMKKNSLEQFGEEYYVIQVEKLILEILTHIFSIRDCLKNKILDTNMSGCNNYKAEIMLNIPKDIKDFKKVDAVLAVSLETESRNIYYFDNSVGKILQFDITNKSIEEKLDGINNKNQLESLLKENIDYFISKNLVPTCNNNNNVNGKLCKEFLDLDDAHKTILSETLDKNENLMLRDLASVLRNKLIHSNLHESKFLTINLNPRYGSSEQKLWYVCDFEHLVKLIGWNNKYLDLSDYYVDNHVIALSSGILVENREHFQELLHRIKQLPDTLIYYIEFKHSIQKKTEILLFDQVKAEIESEQYSQAHAVMYDELLKNKRYRLFTFIDYLNIITKFDEDTSIIVPRPKTFFHMEKAIKDIYELYLCYYTKLHDLISSHWNLEMQKFFDLHKNIGVDEKNIDIIRKQYDYKLPENIYYKDTLTVNN